MEWCFDYLVTRENMWYDYVSGPPCLIIKLILILTFSLEWTCQGAVKMKLLVLRDANLMRPGFSLT